MLLSIMVPVVPGSGVPLLHRELMRGLPEVQWLLRERDPGLDPEDCPLPLQFFNLRHLSN